MIGQIRSENTDGYFQENFYDGEYLRAGVKKNGSSSKFLYYQGELLSEITKKQEERKGNRLILGYGVVASEELGLQNHRQELFQEAPHKRKSFGFYHLDEQNSTVFITGKNQEIQNSYTYDAFGNVRNQKETLHNRILYTGQQYDQESNQYYLRARYYNPTLGRFTQEDVYRGDGLNLYDYCKGNPVVWYDPSGYAKCINKEEKKSNKLLEGEGEIGTFKELKDEGKVGDNVTPHHMPSAQYMLSKGISKNDGLCMNMEMPSPGTGGRHRLTDTYGRNMTNEQKKYYYSLSPRQALAYDINNLRNIYQKQGLYSEIRPKLQEYIKKSKEYMPNLFEKGDYKNE